jgi:hypothetical protein
MKRKLKARKHVRAPLHRNVVPTESHSDGLRAGYFPRTLQTLLLALGYSKTPLFIGTPSLLCQNSYLWHVCAVIYERPMTNRICCIHQVVEASTPRWMFEAGMREAAQEALAVLRHEAMNKSSIHSTATFTSRAEEGAEAVVLPA